ncbi:MAG: hypothetical protein U0228_11385 [Myxococcaceae bacterium]
MPDPISGLTPTLMSVLKAIVASGNGWTSVSALAPELAAAGLTLTEAQAHVAFAQLGHPALRQLPLVEFQGFTGRFDFDSPKFTHVRVTAIGRDVAKGEPPLPMLLVNGAAGRGAWFPSFRVSDVLDACVQLATRGAPDSSYWRGRAWPVRLDGQRGRVRGLQSGDQSVCVFDGRLSTEVDASTKRARLVAALPWPLSFEVVKERLGPLLGQGWLEGATGLVDLSSADASRVGIELEHAIFAEQVRIGLEALQVFSVEIPVSLAVATPEGLMSIFNCVWAFLLRRFELAAQRENEKALGAIRRAANEEAVRVAVAMLDHVLEVIRSADDDAAAVEALQHCFGERERAVVTTLEFPPSHAYANGFTREQAQHLVKQRKLKVRTVEVARSDWASALAEAQSALATERDNGALWEIVLAELRALREELVPRAQP